MKKTTLFFSLAAVVAILFSACKKSSDSLTTLQRIQAKWAFQKEYYHDNYSGVDTRDTTYGVTGDYEDFRTDGKVYFKSGIGLDTASYSLLGDTKIIMTYSYPGYPSYSDTANIIVLNDNQFQIYVKEFDPAPDYYEYTDYLTK